MPPDVVPSYIPQMVDEMVTERALAYEAARLGFQVTDADLADTIRQIVPSLFQDGKFVGRDAYAAMLAQQNLTTRAIRDGDLRRQILITRLSDVALEGTIVTPPEIEQEFRKKNEKIKIEYVKLTDDKYKAEVAAPADDMQTYFKANAARYPVPRRRTWPSCLRTRPRWSSPSARGRRSAGALQPEPGLLPHAGARAGCGTSC